MTLAQIDNFRLQTIIKFNPHKFEREKPTNAFEKQPINAGLALEAKAGQYDGQDNYIVIAFLRPDEDGCNMETVGNRFFEYVKTEDDLDIVRYLYEYGWRRIRQSRVESQD